MASRIYSVNGHQIDPPDMCGIYMKQKETYRYSSLSAVNVILSVNGLPSGEAISQTAGLRKDAFEQAQWPDSYPLTPPITEVRAYIENTIRLCDDVLLALRGK